MDLTIVNFWLGDVSLNPFINEFKSNMKQLFILAILFMAVSAGMDAQQLLTPSFGFSHKKTSYVTLLDGTVITGTVKDIDRKKGLIEFVNIEDGEGKKNKLKAEKIKLMYLPPTAADNWAKADAFLSDATKWSGQKLNEDLINQGYVYFENAKVKIKKKESVLLMQLLNPTFCEKVRVYNDPYAKETTGLGVGGINVVGGAEKSYYIKVEGQKAAFLLEKKNFKDEFPALWQKCPEMKKKYPQMKWSDLTSIVIDYNTCAK